MLSAVLRPVLWRAQSEVHLTQAQQTHSQQTVTNAPLFMSFNRNYVTFATLRPQTLLCFPREASGNGRNEPRSVDSELSAYLATVARADAALTA